MKLTENSWNAVSSNHIRQTQGRYRKGGWGPTADNHKHWSNGVVSSVWSHPFWLWTPIYLSMVSPLYIYIYIYIYTYSHWGLAVECSNLAKWIMNWTRTSWINYGSHLPTSASCLLDIIHMNKSDISCLKTSWAFDIPIHLRALLAAILCWLGTLYASRVAARFWHFRFRLASRCRTNIATTSHSNS